MFRSFANSLIVVYTEVKRSERRLWKSLAPFLAKRKIRDLLQSTPVELWKWQKVIDQNRTYFVWESLKKKKKLCSFHEILFEPPNIYLGFNFCLCGAIWLLALHTYSHLRINYLLNAFKHQCCGCSYDIYKNPMFVSLNIETEAFKQRGVAVYCRRVNMITKR